MKFIKLGNRFINFDLIDYVVDNPDREHLNVTFLQTADAEIILTGTERLALLEWLGRNSENIVPTPAPNFDEFKRLIKETALAKVTYPQTLDGFKELVKSGDYVILDTETTGLDNAEICQISIIDSAGQVLLNTLVKPRNPIPAQASSIHMITDEKVSGAPGWAEIAPRVKEILTGKNVIIYNAVYDRKMMHQSSEKAEIEKIDWKELATFYCAMEFYAEFYGDWNDYHGSYRWQRLTSAIIQQEISGDFERAHSALGDCQMTLALIKKMAGV